MRLPFSSREWTLFRVKNCGALQCTLYILYDVDKTGLTKEGNLTRYDISPSKKQAKRRRAVGLEASEEKIINLCIVLGSDLDMPQVYANIALLEQSVTSSIKFRVYEADKGLRDLRDWQDGTMTDQQENDVHTIQLGLLNGQAPNVLIHLYSAVEMTMKIVLNDRSAIHFGPPTKEYPPFLYPYGFAGNLRDIRHLKNGRFSDLERTRKRIRSISDSDNVRLDQFDTDSLPLFHGRPASYRQSSLSRITTRQFLNLLANSRVNLNPRVSL